MCLFRLRCRLGLYVRLPVVDAPHFPLRPWQYLPPRRQHACSVSSAAIQLRQRLVALAAVLSDRHRLLLHHQHTKTHSRPLGNTIRLLRHHLPERWPQMETASAYLDIHGCVVHLRHAHGRRPPLHLPVHGRTRWRFHRYNQRHERK